jgi:hypothetical protein
VFSFEKSKDEAGPEWSLRIIQLRMSPQEAEARLKEYEAAAAKADAAEKAKAAGK